MKFGKYTCFVESLDISLHLFLINIETFVPHSLTERDKKALEAPGTVAPDVRLQGISKL